VIVGHLGVAAALARLRPRVSLWWLLPAAIAPDLLDVGYALSGICNPFGLYSHTLPAATLLAAVLASAAFLAGRRETASFVALVVLLHLPADFITGQKLYWPGGALHGLRLYDRPLADFFLESVIVAGGWLLLRGASGIPVWARRRRSLAALLVVQATFAILHDHLTKPTACAVATVGLTR
jgi:hypothetical protein